MLCQSANDLKVTNKDAARYAKALKNEAHFAVLSEDFDEGDVVTCFKLEAASSHPRHAILKALGRKYNTLNTQEVDGVLKETPVVKGRRPKNGSEE